MFVCAGVDEKVKILKVLNVIFNFYVSCIGGDWHVFWGFWQYALLLYVGLRHLCQMM